MSHPYEQMPSQAFWRKTVSAQAWGQLDFKPATKFKLKPALKIATAGSCFAQHMARRLESFGLSHWVVEQAPTGVSPERARAICWLNCSRSLPRRWSTRAMSTPSPGWPIPAAPRDAPRA